MASFVFKNEQQQKQPQIISSLQRVSGLETVFISANSLQDLATICSQLGPVINAQAAAGNIVVVVESTNFVNLEPFVSMSMQLKEDADVQILSIMSDYDVRDVTKTSGSAATTASTTVLEVFPSKKESELLYVGKAGKERVYTSPQINAINAIGSLFEKSGLDVYKLNTPLEFLSYQWKFALPKITVEPLSILFEQPFPSDLSDQILAKPLISGLVNEIISIIKTMGCKLFNSYDNENSLLTRLSQLYPPVELSPDKYQSPRLFYDFYHGNELFLDLLLLQPILLADDHGVKTPYLEFLYAMIKQMDGYNNADIDAIQGSVFWLRKTLVPASSFNEYSNEQQQQQQKQAQLQSQENNALKQELHSLRAELGNTKGQLDVVRKELGSAQRALASPPAGVPQQQQQQAIPIVRQQGSSPPQPQQYIQPPQQQQQYKRSSTDPQFDPEMEELSELAATYNQTEQTPQLGKPFSSEGLNFSQQPQIQPPQQQQLPMPSQPQQFHPQQGPSPQQFQQGPPPPSQGPVYYNGGPVPQSYQNRMSQVPQFPPGQGPPPSQGMYAIPNGSRRSLAYGPGPNGPGPHMDYGRNGPGPHMNGAANGGSEYGRYDSSFSSQTSRPHYPGQQPPQQQPYTNGNAPPIAKPTNRKNRVSQNLMAQQLPSRQSMMPPMRHSASQTQLNASNGVDRVVGAFTSAPNGSAVNIAAMANSQSSTSVMNLANGNGSNVNGGLNGSGSSNSLYGSAQQQQQSQQQLQQTTQPPKVDLVPVPEATPSPTPVYVTSGAEDGKKKKKGGMFKFGKKKD